MSETSRHHCVSNSATSRKKDALHILSHEICKYVCAGKKYLHIYISRKKNQSENRHSFIFYYFFLVILFIMNRLRNTKKFDV